jgi:hypothetical protein
MFDLKKRLKEELQSMEDVGMVVVVGGVAHLSPGQVAKEHAIRLKLRRITEGIDDGTICQNCGETISPKRLAAIPEAEYCARCQGELEQKGAIAGHQTVMAITALAEFA